MDGIAGLLQPTWIQAVYASLSVVFIVVLYIFGVGPGARSGARGELPPTDTTSKESEPTSTAGGAGS